MQDVIWAGSFYYVLLILWIFLILMGDSGDAAKEQWVDVLSGDFVVFLIIDSKKGLEGDLFICFLFYFFGFWDGLEQKFWYVFDGGIDDFGEFFNFFEIDLFSLFIIAD